ncbi:MAG: hypothetical protein IH984_12210 [Planctomycetes bacterium]|nr:hypothetical protein [Planctomycetota bacterium]
MKRNLFKLVLFLFLGALITIGISWSFSYRQITSSIWSNIDRGYTSRRHTGTSHDLQLYRFKRIGVIRIRATVANWASLYLPGDTVIPADSLIPLWMSLDDETQRIQDTVRNEIVVEASGWPALALRGRFIVVWRKKTGSSKYEPIIERERTGILILPSKNVDHEMLATWRLIPLSPMWPGFAINTIIYAVILWILWSSPFAARRMIRRKRGHCIKCGYDLRNVEHEKCPECGYELTASAKL